MNINEYREKLNNYYIRFPLARDSRQTCTFARLMADKKSRKEDLKNLQKILRDKKGTKTIIVNVATGHRDIKSELSWEDGYRTRMALVNVLKKNKTIISSFTDSGVYQNTVRDGLPKYDSYRYDANNKHYPLDTSIPVWFIKITKKLKNLDEKIRHYLDRNIELERRFRFAVIHKNIKTLKKLGKISGFNASNIAFEKMHKTLNDYLLDAANRGNIPFLKAIKRCGVRLKDRIPITQILHYTNPTEELNHISFFTQKGAVKTMAFLTSEYGEVLSKNDKSALLNQTMKNKDYFIAAYISGGKRPSKKKYMQFLQQSFLKAAKHGNPDIMKGIFNEIGGDCIQKKNTGILSWLKNLFGIKTKIEYTLYKVNNKFLNAFELTVRSGSVPAVEFLIKKVGMPSKLDGYRRKEVFLHAVEKNHSAMVEKLLSLFPATQVLHTAAKLAKEMGHINILGMLNEKIRNALRPIEKPDEKSIDDPKTIVSQLSKSSSAVNANILVNSPILSEKRIYELAGVAKQAGEKKPILNFLDNVEAHTELKQVLDKKSERQQQVILKNVCKLMAAYVLPGLKQMEEARSKITGEDKQTDAMLAAIKNKDEGNKLLNYQQTVEKELSKFLYVFSISTTGQIKEAYNAKDATIDVISSAILNYIPLVGNALKEGAHYAVTCQKRKRANRLEQYFKLKDINAFAYRFSLMLTLAKTDEILKITNNVSGLRNKLKKFVTEKTKNFYKKLWQRITTSSSRAENLQGEQVLAKWDVGRMVYNMRHYNYDLDTSSPHNLAWSSLVKIMGIDTNLPIFREQSFKLQRPTTEQQAFVVGQQHNLRDEKNAPTGGTLAKSGIFTQRPAATKKIAELENKVGALEAKIKQMEKNISEGIGFMAKFSQAWKGFVVWQQNIDGSMTAKASSSSDSPAGLLKALLKGMQNLPEIYQTQIMMRENHAASLKRLGDVESRNAAVEEDLVNLRAGCNT